MLPRRLQPPESPDMMRGSQQTSTTMDSGPGKAALEAASPTRSSVVTEASFQPYAAQRDSSQLGVGSSGLGPPIPSADVLPPPQDVRTRRRLLGQAPGAGNASGLQPQLQQSQQGISVGANGGSGLLPTKSMSPSRGGSDKESPQRKISRLTARAHAHASTRDSGSEHTAAKDVYRDERGRRVERPRTVKSDIHIIGEICGASGFKRAQGELFCRYRLVYDGLKSWAVVRGREVGCTQISSSAWGSDGYAVWEHPLDIHLTTQKLEAWPKLLLMVYAREAGVKDVFVSYALVPLPNLPGAHTLSARTWYPTESDRVNMRNVFASYLGMAPRLDDDLSDMGFLTDMRVREEAGPYISSIGAGTVHLRVQMLFRHASALTRQLGDTLYKSLENFTASVEASHKKEMMRSAAMQECQAGLASHGKESAGLKQIREGRQARFDAARQALDARRASQTSHASSGGEGNERSRSADVIGRRSQQAPPSSSQGAQSPGRRLNEGAAGGGGRNARSAPRDGRGSSGAGEAEEELRQRGSGAARARPPPEDGAGPPGRGASDTTTAGRSGQPADIGSSQASSAAAADAELVRREAERQQRRGQR